MVPEINTTLNNASQSFPAQQRELLDSEAVRANKAYLVLKRLFDIAASLTALVVLSPLFIVVALIIFIDDPHGSPFYSQLRVGRNGFSGSGSSAPWLSTPTR